MEKYIALPMVLVFFGTIVTGAGGFWASVTANREKVQLGREKEQSAQKIQELNGRLINVETLSTLLPGNKPDPPTTARDKPPTDAIKLYLGKCIAWWSPKVLDTYSVVTINNEPVLTLSLQGNGLFLSGKIRRQKKGREIMNLINNQFIRKPNVFCDVQRPNEHELILSDESGERLLYVNYLNEKAIAIEGIFYDSQGNRVLTINNREIVDMADNHLLPGVSLGGSENIFTYQTVPQRHQLTVRVTEPAAIGGGDFHGRLELLYEGSRIEDPSRATILLSNTGREPIRLGIDGTMEIATPGQVLDMEMSPPMEASDYISWDGKRLSLKRVLIRPNEAKAINLLMMQSEGKCRVDATLRDGGEVMIEYADKSG